jgi:hypothetical protein
MSDPESDNYSHILASLIYHYSCVCAAACLHANVQVLPHYKMRTSDNDTWLARNSQVAAMIF